MSDVAQAFLDESRRYLLKENLPKIERCLESLTEEDVWWRPNEQSNSIGNLLMHLAGNLRQWIISGVGGADDVRQRAQEFDERSPLPVATLMAQLRAYKEGTRRGEADPGQIMASNMKYFTDMEILATAAYVASLERD